MEVGAGASAGGMGKGSVAADCAIMYRSRGASSDDTIGICLSDPACCYVSPRCIYIGYGRYLFVDIVPRASADLGVTSIG